MPIFSFPIGWSFSGVVSMVVSISFTLLFCFLYLLLRIKDNLFYPYLVVTVGPWWVVFVVVWIFWWTFFVNVTFYYFGYFKKRFLVIKGNIDKGVDCQTSFGKLLEGPWMVNNFSVLWPTFFIDFFLFYMLLIGFFGS